MRLTGAEIVIECLKEQGVTTVFGYPGNSVLTIYDQLFLHADEITHVLTSHEQGAAHAADGYARATGKPGVVFATSGPGSTNLVTGIATAYMDSIPVVAITCNVSLPSLGKDSFQEIDISGITMPITKHNYIVKDIAMLADTIRSAFTIAQTGRPGPVLIDIPKDITEKTFEYKRRTPKRIPVLKYYSENDLAAAAEMINASTKPFILAGGGVISAGASHAVRKLSKKLNAPVSVSLMGLGAIPDTDSYHAGMIGMHGTAASTFCMQNCDLLIALGTRFSDRVLCEKNKFAPNAKILHIDVDAAEINKNISADCALIGDTRAALLDLLPLLEDKPRGTLFNTVLAHRKKSKNTASPYVSPQMLIASAQSYAGDDAIFTTEVGQNQIWAAQYLKIKRPRTFLTSGGLGTMGFGLGAAIGACMGTGKTVVNIAGDGSFYMNMNELKTAVDYHLPIKILLMNNGVLGMVRQWQKLLLDKRYSNTTLSTHTDFVLLAQAFGAAGFRIESCDEIDSVMKAAFETNGPCLIDCHIPKDENVLPITVAGTKILTMKED